MKPVDWVALGLAVIALGGVIAWGYAFAARKLYARDKEMLGHQDGGGPNREVSRRKRKAPSRKSTAPAGDGSEGS